ncbi:hypothetical protein [Aurantimonas sp. VKM B-3413]|uniref:hypothetical protein n=1 Tax=Aurantimonas sp. VKM B-3413 TaxID=2779401 RepID=UPI001E3465AE|nr:hypothetical protein [Aurantimonas sp. VKM B-3413]MCB8837593.1 hypothetical protein [Aurantimonas sp. VKM B-3413]
MPRRSAPQSSLLLVLSMTATLAGAMVSTAGAPAFAASPAEQGSSACAGRYHDALQAVRGGVYQTIKGAKADTHKADDRLPGTLLFTPPFRQRGSEERLALIEANRLAKSRGRPVWSASSDDRWIVDRIASELGDYLSQEQTPYLCGGVPGYLSTLRSYLARVGGSPDRTKALVAAQRTAAETSIRAALEAMRPVPIPRFAPRLRPADDPMSGLRPSADIGRPMGAQTGETSAADASRTASVGETASGSPAGSLNDAGGDPGLPPLAPPKPIALETEGDRIGALERLVKAAEAAGFLARSAEIEAERPAPPGDVAKDDQTEPDTTGAIEAAPRPVLVKLAAVKPLIVGAGTPIRDPLVRRTLVAAFSDIEALDYLENRPSDEDGSVLHAIGATLDAIEDARKASCDCAAQ